MRKKILLAGLGISAVALIVVILAALAVKDGNPPEITFKEDTIVYKDGEDPDVLLNAVEAMDKEDGDVSDSLIVKNLYRISDKYGIVVFAAKDSSNNVTVVSRGFTYSDAVETSAQPQGQGAQKPEGGDSQPEEESGGTGSGSAGAGNGTTAGGSGAGASTGEGEEPENGQTNGEGQGTAANGQNLDYAKLKKENMAAGIPYLKLTQYAVSLKKGSSFVVQNYIEEAVEGKGGAGKDAMRHIHVDNKPDMKKAGVYDVTVYVRDTEGNVSNKEVIKVTVE